MDKIMYVTVKLVVKDSANAEDILQADYNFDHEDIISTEWVDIEEKSYRPKDALLKVHGEWWTPKNI